MEKLVRVRFAPSPTGYLHVGGLRTALYNYLFAKHNGGKFILRIEDTDQSRKVEGAVENLIATLEWAGIHYDEGPNREGNHGPYVQSERLKLYHQHAIQLVERGKAYYCFCTQERLEEIRQKQSAAKLQPSYDQHCRDLPKDEAERRNAAGEKHVVRMKVPLGGELTFEDIIRGKVTFSYSVLDDQVILKSDGFPTYHLAVVVDDHLMEITHVIRGEEWLSSTPKHVLLYQFFGWELPKFAHLPLLLNPDKSKLSKRQGDVAVEDYRAKGYLKEAIINFVAFLGWNPGDEREIFLLDELVKEFSLERVGKSGAVFNIEKLNWLNAQHLRKKPIAELLGMVKEYLSPSVGLVQSSLSNKHFDDAYVLQIIGAMRERALFVKDLIENCPYFFEPPTEYDPAIVKKRWKEQTPDHMRKLIEEFKLLEGPKKEDYEAALHRVAGALGVSNGELIHALRLAVSGMGIGPGLYDIVFILGKEETIRRISAAIERLK
ncbi:MAG: glutamate--tRNA ligase [Ignavibacteriales bacterium]|nr:glutamate--tRNA ligase [Ignavibacteriales bacterium]